MGEVISFPSAEGRTDVSLPVSEITKKFLMEYDFELSGTHTNPDRVVVSVSDICAGLLIALNLKRCRVAAYKLHTIIGTLLKADASLVCLADIPRNLRGYLYLPDARILSRARVEARWLNDSHKL